MKHWAEKTLAQNARVHRPELEAGIGEGVGDDARELLDALVRMARAATGAAAASVCVLDEDAKHLRFEAVSGEGEGSLVGTQFSARRGIAGWVASTGEPMAVEDVSADPRFARQVAEQTGFTPVSIMAAPVSYRGTILGVLEVLDAAPGKRSSIADLEQLADFGSRAGVALHVLASGSAMLHRAGAFAPGDEELTRQLEALHVLLRAQSPGRRAVSLALIADLCAMIGQQ
jgi:GAF domain-containing protein